MDKLTNHLKYVYESMTFTEQSIDLEDIVEIIPSDGYDIEYKDEKVDRNSHSSDCEQYVASFVMGFIIKDLDYFKKNFNDEQSVKEAFYQMTVKDQLSDDLIEIINKKGGFGLEIGTKIESNITQLHISKGKVFIRWECMFETNC